VLYAAGTAVMACEMEISQELSDGAVACETAQQWHNADCD